MANDVTIVVSADLGDTLVKLDLAKHAIKDLGDEAEETAAKEDIASSSTGIFSGILAQLGPDAAGSIPALTTISGAIVSLGGIAFIAAAGAVALADAFGTIVAIAADFVAPITVVLGLIGGLGAAFAVAATKAFGMHEDGFGKAISGLKDQFSQLTKTLVSDFMPEFQFLIHNAHDALDFLNKIAKLPLNQAFRQLAQQGIPAVAKFLEQIGHMVGKPIRLAFQIAFGTGKAGNEASAAASRLWNDLSNFLFGYSVSHPIRLDGRVIKIEQRHVDGIFQPLIDWFNRHNFTAQGIKIGHQILDGFLGSGVAHRMGQFLIQVLEDAAKTAAIGMINQLERLMAWILGASQRAGNAFNHAMISAAESAFHTIEGLAGDAFNKIVSIFSHPIQLVVDIVEHIFGPLSLGSGGVSAPGGGTVPGRAGGFTGPHFSQTNNFHLHSSSGANIGQFRRDVHLIGRELDRQRGILAGGV